MPLNWSISMYVERISVTDKAKAVIDQLRENHGELMFHQSGGCCDGSAQAISDQLKPNKALHWTEIPLSLHSRQ